MADDSQRARNVVTAAHLVHLLSTVPRYVRTWQVHGKRQRAEVNERAVAKVLALHLWDKNEVPDTDRALPARLKNTVNRALRGERLTGKLLEDFIGAFDMDENDQVELWSLFSGMNSVTNTIYKPRVMTRRQRHRTVSLFEHWYFDSSGALLRHRTTQCIEAQEDGVDSYLANHEPQVMEIDVIHGGWLGRHYEHGDGIIGDEIMLDQVLRRGERAAIEYCANYESDHYPLEVRRAARGRTHNVTLAMHFHRSRLPKRVWFAIWGDHYLGNPNHEEPIAISKTYSVSRCLEYIEQTVVGFRLEW